MINVGISRMAVLRAALASPIGRLGTLALAIPVYIYLPDLLFRGSGLLVLGAVVLLHARFVDGTIEPVGFTRPAVLGRSLRRGFVAALALYALMKFLVNPVLHHLTHQAADLSRLDALRGNVPAVLQFLLEVWTTAAVGEEVLFRGFAIRQVTAALGDSVPARALAVIVSSVLFGLAHAYQGLTGVLSTGLTGMLLALLFLSGRRSLWTNIFAHGFVDTVSILVIFASLDLRLTRL
ncbi:MAG: CPBP family intramembrane metalloprotease [Deltaproteobacteria bacterium]|nr:CPBP family intramembrane metalloprotease [Deltaproteobacteria bacterium]